MKFSSGSWNFSCGTSMMEVSQYFLSLSVATQFVAPKQSPELSCKDQPLGFHGFRPSGLTRKESGNFLY